MKPRPPQSSLPCSQCGAERPTKQAQGRAWCVACFPEAVGGKHRPARDSKLDLAEVARVLGPK